MGMLFSLSEKLRRNIYSKAREVERLYEGLVKFDEYIVLPDYGERIIIRFDLSKNNMSLSELDQIECNIRDILGKDYWGNLVGGNFIKFGFDSNKMIKALECIDKKIEDKIIKYDQNTYTNEIIHDKNILRDTLKLREEEKIWEIQYNEEETIRILILIVDESRESLEGNELLSEKTILLGNEVAKVIYLKNHSSFRGIIKAYSLAEEKQIALNNLIINHKKFIL